MPAAPAPVVFVAPGDLHLTEPGRDNHCTALRVVDEVNRVVRPLGAGYPAGRLGYNGFFYTFAGIAAAAAALFITWMPEARHKGREEGGRR
jgi:hypothetical protein